MRSRRLSFFAGWAAVALLAAVGLAAFGTSDEVPNGVVVEAAGASMGHTAGAFAGISFALLAGPVDDITVTDRDTFVQPAELRIPNRSGATSDEEKAKGTIASEASGWLSEVEIRILVSEYFDTEDVNKAVRVAWCESRFNPKSIDLRTGAVGIFHHLPRYWAERSEEAGFVGADPTDPEASIAAAAWAVYHGGGWDVFACRG